MAEPEEPNARQRANERAERVAEAWAATEEGPVTVRTPGGPVALGSVELVAHGDHLAVEVTVGQPASGDPHFRIFNPPLMVRGEGGALVEDPLAAIAQAIADHGGAQRRTGRKRR